MGELARALQESGGMLDSLLSDLRDSLRGLRQRPASAAVIIGTLALGIGINSAFFTGVYAMVWRPLPFHEPHRLVAVYHAQESSGESWISLSPAAYFEILDEVDGLAGAGAFDQTTFNIRSDLLPERIRGVRVNAELFPLLGVSPARGRMFTAADDQPGAAPVVLLSDQLWRRSFGADPEILGRLVHLNDEAHEVVGVMPPGFAFPLWHEAWTPLRLARGGAPSLDGGLQMIARLAPGTTEEAARSSFEAVAESMAAAHPDTLEGAGLVIRQLHDSWMPPVTQVAGIVMQGLVTLVLLIVCANVANMVMAQASTRRRELALRAALGADRARLVRQALVESLVLSFVGGALGLILAAWQGAWLEQISPVGIPYWLRMELDGRVLAYTLAICVLTALGIGLLPALRSSRFDLASALESGGRSDGGVAGGDGRLRGLLVVGEYALAVVVLVGALLMVRSYSQLRGGDVGFAVDQRTSLRVSLRGEEQVPEKRARFLDGAVRHLSTLPEVERAAATSFFPVSQDGFRAAELEVDGLHFEEGRAPRATVQAVSEGYFETFEIPLRSGRTFTRSESSPSNVSLPGGEAATEHAGAGGRAVAVIGCCPPGLRFQQQ
ncbi:MAG: ABC transporter permease [Holophagales bacterium]|nr:ABC transporter permease [Holophagales bacterium]